MSDKDGGVWLPVEELGRRVRELRKQKRLEGAEVGRAIGYKDGSALSSMENGTKRLPGARLRQLAHVLGVPPSHFMREDAGGTTEDPVLLDRAAKLTVVGWLEQRAQELREELDAGRPSEGPSRPIRELDEERDDRDALKALEGVEAKTAPERDTSTPEQSPASTKDESSA